MKYLLIIGLLISLVSCKKWFDYRNPYVGDYKCYYLKTSKGFYQDSNNIEHTFIDTLEFSKDTVISITKSDIHNEIIFLDWYLTIQEDGSITSGTCFKYPCIECRYYSLHIIDNSITFSARCGPLGFANFYELNGKKI